MAPSKPLPDNHTTTNFTKEYGQQPAKYLPATPSPLSPRSSSSSGGRPASLPRRHTVSGPTPSSTPAAVSDSEATPPTATVPTRPRAKRHSRRHSGSPTERLMRYKAALAWRSATTAPSSPRPDDAYISPLRRHPVQGLAPSPGGDDSDGGNTTTTTNTRTAPHDASPRHQCNTNQNQNPHHRQYKDSEKANPHFIIQVQGPPVSPQAARPVPIFKDTSRSSPATSYYQRDQAVGYPYQCQYQYGYGYGTNYTTTRCSPDGPHNGYHKGTTGHPLDTVPSFTNSGSTITLQRAALIAAAVLFCGMYMAICAFSLIAARGHDHHDDVDDLLVEGIYGYVKGNEAGETYQYRR